MKTSNRIITTVVVVFCMSMPVFAGGGAQHFSDALNHSSQAVAHSTAAGFKFVSGAVAIPLMVGGEIGKAGGDIGEALWDEANTPLPISEDIITTGPSPAEAMEKEENK